MQDKFSLWLLGPNSRRPHAYGNLTDTVHGDPALQNVGTSLNVICVQDICGTNSPCKNGGKCANADNPDGFTCTCPFPFAGPTCSEGCQEGYEGLQCNSCSDGFIVSASVSQGTNLEGHQHQACACAELSIYPKPHRTVGRRTRALWPAPCACPTCAKLLAPVKTVASAPPLSKLPSSPANATLAALLA